MSEIPCTGWDPCPNPEHRHLATHRALAPLRAEVIDRQIPNVTVTVTNPSPRAEIEQAIGRWHERAARMEAHPLANLAIAEHLLRQCAADRELLDLVTSHWYATPLADRLLANLARRYGLDGTE